MAGVRVVPVGPEELERFVELPLAIERDEPGFIPPLRAAELRALTGGAVPGGALQPFRCELDGRPAGRIAALLQPRLPGAGGQPLGQVGFYACVDSAAASGALFEAALGWLRSRGCREVVGPMDGGVHRHYRLMTSGFDERPFLLEPRNPRWYPAQFLAAGFRPVHRWRSYDLPHDRVVRVRGRLAALALRRAGGLEVEFPDLRDGSAILARVHPLLDAVWAAHPAWRTLSLEEFAESFGPLLPLLPPRHLAILKDERGLDAGMGFMYPDWADEVRALDGDASGWGRWMGQARARRVVAHTVAVRPEVRSRAAAALVVAAGLEVALESGYQAAVFALVGESFRFLGRGHAATREYALYGRPL